MKKMLAIIMGICSALMTWLVFVLIMYEVMLITTTKGGFWNITVQMYIGAYIGAPLVAAFVVWLVVRAQRKRRSG